MIETRLLSLWDALVGSAALLAIIVLALCVMVGAVKLEDIPRQRGVIVNIIGAGGERLDPMYIVGAVGNSGLMSLTRAIGGNSPQFGVRVLGVNPGPVMTDRIEALGRRRAATLYGDENRWRESFATMPFGRPASVDEIAATVVFLASDLCSYTSGTIVTIDGGLTYRS